MEGTKYSVVVHVRALCMVLLFTVCSAAHSAGSAPTIDPTFEGGGTAVQTFLDQGGVATNVFVQSDGNIVVVGNLVYAHAGFGDVPLTSPVVARYLANGSPDPSFGGNGFVNPAQFSPLLQQRDEKLVGVGPRGLLRMNSDGSLDTTITTTGAASIAWFPNMARGQLLQQTDDKILAAGDVGAGTAVLTLLRFNGDGSLDTTFNSVGALITPHGASSNDYIAGFVLQPDGKMIAAATSTIGGIQTISLVRYLRDGGLDPSFGTAGRAVIDNSPLAYYVEALTLALQPSGRLIVAAGYLDQPTGNSTLLVEGVTSNGSIDPTFGTNGAVKINVGPGSIVIGFWQVLVQPDSKMLLLLQNELPATTSAYGILRLDPDGAVDTTFGNGGLWYPPAPNKVVWAALQADSKLILAGSVDRSAAPISDFALARYLTGASAAIEFHNVALDHYFVSSNPLEVHDLDAGVHSGWMRTGESFDVFGSPLSAPAEFVPVCRFYIPPEHGDSHFFTASSSECLSVQERTTADPNYSGYVFESPNAFYVALPDPNSGACPNATTPVYRLWNGRADSNHRYVTDPAIKAQMLALGYVAEGYGPQSVAMCASNSTAM